MVTISGQRSFTTEDNLFHFGPTRSVECQTVDVAPSIACGRRRYIEARFDEPHKALVSPVRARCRSLHVNWVSQKSVTATSKMMY
ncbi:hypothetical protein WN943_000812 [Citrus x changshan-huyou]